MSVHSFAGRLRVLGGLVLATAVEAVKALLVFGSIATVHGIVAEIQVVIHHILSIMSFVIAP